MKKTRFVFIALYLIFQAISAFALDKNLVQKKLVEGHPDYYREDNILHDIGIIESKKLGKLYIYFNECHWGNYRVTFRLIICDENKILGEYGILLMDKPWIKNNLLCFPYEEEIGNKIDFNNGIPKTVYVDGYLNNFTIYDINLNESNTVNLNVYHYAGNNPVKYIDPTGEDGEITGTGTEKDPFIIKANYYYEKGSLNEQQIKGLNNAISEYNNKGKVRKIKNDDGTKSYVRFNISAEEVEKGKLTTAIMNDFITNEGGQDIFFGNSLGTRANEGSNNTDLGSANGYRVDINQSSIDNFARNNHVDKDDLIKWTYVHEIGHNLGLDHSDKTDIMSQMNVIFHDGNILGGTTTSSPTITHPKVDTKGVKIMLDNRNKPRKGHLGIIRSR